VKSGNTLEQSVIGSVILPIARVLRNRSFDAVEIIESAGIDSALAARPDWRVGIEPFNRLMKKCVSITDDEAFGLYAAKQLQPQDLHSLGFGWLASDTVYDGLCRLVRYSKLVSSISQLTLEINEDLVKLHSWAKPTSYLDDYEYASKDFGVGMIAKMCQLNFGEYLSPYQINLDRPLPAKPELWNSMLATRVSFGCQQSTLIWSRPDVQGHLLTGDPALALILDQHAKEYIDSYTDRSTARAVAEQVLRRLPDGPPSQDEIADDLCVSKRTLQRKLKDEGVSFSHILQDSRMHLAKSYLRQPSRSVVEVSYLLGFAEPSAFSRAFKRWTGETPASYRNLAA
jgi:AraC-like DNA-binding protein